ncbi:hypothetical protein QSJ19_12860 [Gordonia sp. ABSL11-1]|uniref:hypothetical protein n=1 Tax=Gordonia sp. ABSL11-1 TaxID=3053924 RepID=UPI002572A092|nr:hypothetical protein [Gordonia sp. ABSL11-1]MDL9946468.1 hypothetical protein [Gordonia sp. ABSL11-1]
MTITAPADPIRIGDVLDILDDQARSSRRWPIAIDIVGALIPQVMVLAFLVVPY